MLAIITCLTVGLRQRLLQHGGEVLQHDDSFGAGIVELEFQLARLVQRVDVDHGQAGAQDAGMQTGYCNTFGIMMATRAPRCRPMLCSQAAKAREAAIELVVGHRLAHADEGVAAAKLAEAFLEHRHQRGIARRVDIGRHARRIVLEPMRSIGRSWRFPMPPALVRRVRRSASAFELRWQCKLAQGRRMCLSVAPPKGTSGLSVKAARSGRSGAACAEKGLEQLAHRALGQVAGNEDQPAAVVVVRPAFAAARSGGRRAARHAPPPACPAFRPASRCP